ncbi:MAG: pyridoxal 5'-phosphate synthase glutaminase subunit PdxT [bacterium]
MAGDRRRGQRRAVSAVRGLRPARVSARPAPSGPPRVGVLAVQGDFALHAAALAEVGCTPVRVSLPEHLEGLEAMVLPGGESSTMLRLLDSTGLRAPLERFVRTRPVLGTCAGLILLAREADRLPRPTLGALDVRVERNAWGRQVHSFAAAVDAPALGGAVDGVFIRAPRIRRVGAGVEVFARYRGEPVGVRQGHVAAIAFHPELTGDRRLHAWFVREVAGLVPAGAR